MCNRTYIIDVHVLVYHIVQIRLRRTDTVTENCALLGCYAANNVNFLPRFRDRYLDP